MSDKVRVFCLMFDEMSIRRLTVLKALRTLEAMAGQVILQIMTWSLCMLRGVCKKWKQPVAFYLIRGSTKRETLVIFLKEVLDACHNAGLVFVTTVFDMVINNFMAL